MRHYNGNNKITEVKLIITSLLNSDIDISGQLINDLTPLLIK